MTNFQEAGGGQMPDIQAELQRFSRDTAYYEAHQEELLEQYPEQWVAIYNEQVVGASPDARELLHNLQAKGLPVGQVFCGYLTRKEELWILFI
jgi:hypothetical protein